MTDDAPLILTLLFDPEAFERFDALRREHFPSELNLIPAHLTLFHHLPAERIEEITDHLRSLASEEEVFSCRVSGLRLLGKGVAFTVECPHLERLRTDLASDWFDWLTTQDRQRFKPHVTIQNKVKPERAESLFERMDADFEPFGFEACGLLLWRYRGGPWEAVETFDFGEADSGTAPNAGAARN
ncbi:2'-5' RNA ligase [Fulvimarina manganoxydans]|uniref:2'-5' RNA ligase n=1 Tax=Fulvimarina manganoxydans TaxID=937218 RepID=A0A1W1ZUF5_9HYPH|nr:2'-5' RNA ligase family protein [Fulvimarina manganoxydans]SMC52034.1 2'-5' RNA ligase [Fulvimarina manganoxydans]